MATEIEVGSLVSIQDSDITGTVLSLEDNVCLIEVHDYLHDKDKTIKIKIDKLSTLNLSLEREDLN